MWIKGMVNEYDFHIKQYEEGSDYGIRGGRISKLEIWKGGELLAQYDRGWSVKPRDAKTKAVYDQILRQYN